MPVLGIYIEGSASREEATAVAAHCQMLSRREWMTTSPRPVDVVGDADRETGTFRTVGICIDLPESGQSSAEELVREDVEAFVASMSGLARDAGIEFVVDYADEQIGELDGGHDDLRLITSLFGS